MHWKLFCALLLAWPMAVIANCDDVELDAYVQQQIESSVLPEDVNLDDSIREAYRGTCAMEKLIKNQRMNIGKLNTQLSNALTTKSQLTVSLNEYQTVFGDVRAISERQNDMIKELVDDFDLYQRKQKAQYVVPTALGILVGYMKYQGDENATALDVMAYGAAGFGISLTLDQRYQLKVATVVAKFWPN